MVCIFIKRQKTICIFLIVMSVKNKFIIIVFQDKNGHDIVKSYNLNRYPDLDYKKFEK